MYHDVIVCESEFSDEVGRVTGLAADAEAMIADLMSLLERISAEGIQEGATAKRFKLYVTMAGKLQGRLEALIAEQATFLGQFVGDIVDADNYSYHGP